MAAPVTFALSPALVEPGILNYGTAEGSSIYKQAIKPLKEDFECTPEGLNVLLAQVKDRAIAFGWTHILEIPRRLKSDH